MFSYLNSGIQFWSSSLLVIVWLQQRSNSYVPEASLCLVFIYASFSLAPLWRKDGGQPLKVFSLLTAHQLVVWMCFWHGQFGVRVWFFLGEHAALKGNFPLVYPALSPCTNDFKFFFFKLWGKTFSQLWKGFIQPFRNSSSDWFSSGFWNTLQITIWKKF